MGALGRSYGNRTTTAAFLIALVLCVLVPASFYSPLILLEFTRIIDRRVHDRRARPTPEEGSTAGS